MGRCDGIHAWGRRLRWRHEANWCNLYYFLLLLKNDLFCCRLLAAGPPPPHPAAGGDESPMGVPPAYSSLGFEDSGDQDANDCSDNQPLISTEIV